MNLPIFKLIFGQNDTAKKNRGFFVSI